MHMLLNYCLRYLQDDACSAFGTEEDRIPEREHSNFFESFLQEQPSVKGKSFGSVLRCSHFVEVPHINQLYSWDCGLACVLMVFRTVGINSHNIESLAKLCCTTSIWTVDLAYILQKFSISFSYYTVTFGVNPNYSVETFYKVIHCRPYKFYRNGLEKYRDSKLLVSREKEQLPNDLARVDMLFKKSLEAGINIQCRSFSREEICLLIVSGKYIAIALVDQHKLSHSWLKDVFMTDFNDSNSNYTGHYVIICGYDTLTDEFEIRDPASTSKHVRISSHCLEEARKSFGTDEDLLLISLEKSEKELISPSTQLSSQIKIGS